MELNKAEDDTSKLLCPNCRSSNINEYDDNSGYWKCNSCGSCWVFHTNNTSTDGLYDEYLYDENREIGGIWGDRNPATGEIWDTF